MGFLSKTKFAHDFHFNKMMIFMQMWLSIWYVIVGGF